MLGVFFILLQCVIWIVASILTQYMFIDDHDNHIGSPFLMTYTGISLMIIFLPVHWWSERQGSTSMSENDKERKSIHEVDSFDTAIAEANSYSEIISVIGKRSLLHASSKKKWDHKKHVLAAIQYVLSRRVKCLRRYWSHIVIKS